MRMKVILEHGNDSCGHIIDKEYFKPPTKSNTASLPDWKYMRLLHYRCVKLLPSWDISMHLVVPFHLYMS